MDQRVSTHAGMDELDRETLTELIDSIEISERKFGGKKKLEITFRYGFISDYLQKVNEGIA